MKTVKLVFGFVLIVGGIYSAWQLLPPYFHHYQLNDTIETQTRELAYRNNSEEEIKNIIIRAAHENDVNLTPEQITVQRSGLDLNISVQYTVTVDLAVTQVNLNFASSSKGSRM